MKPKVYDRTEVLQKSLDKLVKKITESYKSPHDDLTLYHSVNLGLVWVEIIQPDLSAYDLEEIELIIRKVDERIHIESRAFGEAFYDRGSKTYFPESIQFTYRII